MTRKLIIIQVLAAFVLMICAIGASAYDCDYSFYISAVRRGEMNSYTISVNVDLLDKDNADFKYIEDLLDESYGFETYEPRYTCKVYFDDDTECFLDGGWINYYFRKTGNIYWDIDYTFDEVGSHGIYAEIYRNGELIMGFGRTLEVYPPGYSAPEYAHETISTSYAARLAALINEMRIDNEDLKRMKVKAVFNDMAEDRIMTAIYNDSWTHNDLGEYLWLYDIGYSAAEEVFISGASSPEEALEMLENSARGREIIYGDHNAIAVGAVKDSRDVMQWVIEVIDY